jgi:multisubunit Na+/H+ antiporter MnhC subunit
MKSLNLIFDTVTVSPWTTSEIIAAVIVGLAVIAVIVKTVVNAEKEQKAAQA